MNDVRGVGVAVDAVVSDLDASCQALAQAHVEHVAALAPIAVPPDVAARAGELRDELTVEAKALARRGSFDEGLLEQMDGGPGCLNVAYDLAALVLVLRARWQAIGEGAARRSSQLDEAEWMFERVTAIYSERARQSMQLVVAAEKRQRALTVLVVGHAALRHRIRRKREGSSPRCDGGRQHAPR